MKTGDHIKKTAELSQLGISASTIYRRVGRGRLIKLRHGVYVDAAIWNEFSTFQRCYAHHVAVAKSHPRSVLSHESAAMMYDISLLNLPDKVHISSATYGIKSRENLRAHGCSSDVLERTWWIEDARVTSPLDTLIDCAKSLPHKDAVCVADQFLHRGLVDRAAVQSSILGLRGPGALRAGRVVERMSAHAESVAETLVRVLLYDWNLEMPIEQGEVLTSAGARYRPDFIWEHLRLILEVDGEVKYSGKYGKPEDVIRAEHRRQRELERDGWKIIRVRWGEITKTPWTLRQELMKSGVKVRQAS